MLNVPFSPRLGRLTPLVVKWLKPPSHRRVELDEVGSFVWELCDGQRTIETIVQQTSKHYKMHRREAEVSVTSFLQMLHERNFIAFYKMGRKKGNRASADLESERLETQIAENET